MELLWVPMPLQAKADSGMMEMVPLVGTRGSITLSLVDET